MRSPIVIATLFALSLQTNVLADGYSNQTCDTGNATSNSTENASGDKSIEIHEHFHNHTYHFNVTEKAPYLADKIAKHSAHDHHKHGHHHGNHHGNHHKNGANGTNATHYNHLEIEKVYDHHHDHKHHYEDPECGPDDKGCPIQTTTSAVKPTVAPLYMLQAETKGKDFNSHFLTVFYFLYYHIMSF